MTHIQQAVQFLKLMMKIKRGEEICELEADTTRIKHVSVCRMVNLYNDPLVEDKAEITIVFEVPALSIGVGLDDEVPMDYLLPGGGELLDG